MSSPAERQCEHCKTSQRGLTQRFKCCSRCGSTYYCSSEHQRVDWPSHRRSCQPSNVNPANTHPAPAQTSDLNPLDAQQREILMSSVKSQMQNPVAVHPSLVLEASVTVRAYHVDALCDLPCLYTAQEENQHRIVYLFLLRVGSDDWDLLEKLINFLFIASPIIACHD